MREDGFAPLSLQTYLILKISGFTDCLSDSESASLISKLFENIKLKILIYFFKIKTYSFSKTVNVRSGYFFKNNFTARFTLSKSMS